jgi:hypothetical protein
MLTQRTTVCSDKRHLFLLGISSRTSNRKERGKGMSREIQISTRTLIVLCGTAGAGKSTFARQHFQPTQVVSADTCRALICDGECTQDIDPDTFDLFHFIIQKRLKLGTDTRAERNGCRGPFHLANEQPGEVTFIMSTHPRDVQRNDSKQVV